LIAEAEERKKTEEELGEGEGSQEADKQSVGKKSVGGSQKSIGKLDHNASNLTTVSAIPERNNVEDDFKGVLLGLWKELSSSYKGQMKKVMVKQGVQRENIQQFLYTVQV